MVAFLQNPAATRVGTQPSGEPKGAACAIGGTHVVVYLGGY